MRGRRLLAVCFAAAMLIAACGDDDDSNVDASDSDQTTDTSADPASGPEYGDKGGSDDGSAEDATVKVASTDELGEYLVDAEGRTLYLFTQDDGTATACTGGCADNWPPLVADGDPTGGDGVDAGELGTADGIEPNQVTYHGHLLYYFAGDQEPGDTNGTSIPDWFAVNPAGEAIEVDAA